MDDITRRYHQALDLVTRQKLDEGIALLRGVVDEKPDHADAWEVLGVAYQRAGRLDEAIAVTEELARRNPDCIMAWVNLSRFLQKKGKIPEAEAAQTKARVLGWKADLAAKKAAGSAPPSTPLAKSGAPSGAVPPSPQAATFSKPPGPPPAPDAAKLEGMRRVVLQDPKSAIARLTYGNALMAAGMSGEAVEQLRAAVEAKPDYSAAYVALGKALEAAGRGGEAVLAYRAGVEAAAAKGDLQAKRQMEERLAALARA